MITITIEILEGKPGVMFATDIKSTNATPSENRMSYRVNELLVAFAQGQDTLTSVVGAQQEVGNLIDHLRERFKEQNTPQG